MPGDRAKKLREVGGDARDQASGTVSNVRQSLGKFTLDNTLPNAIVGTISEAFETGAKAAGRDSQAMGMTSSVTIIIIGVLTSWTGFGFLLIGLGALLFAYNTIRLIPVANEYHKKAGRRVGLYKDRDVPLWERD
jgi:hypothetical protein